MDDETPDPTEESPLGDAEWELSLLRELAEMGMDLTRKAHANAMVEADDPEAGHAAQTAFARLSRVVQHSVRLHSRMRDETWRHDTARRAEHRRAIEAGRNMLRQVRLKQFRQLALEVITEANIQDPLDHRFRAPIVLRDMLNNETDNEDVPDVPLSLLVQEFCAEVDLPGHWRKWATRSWAIEEIEQRPEGSIYANWPELPPIETATGPPPWIAGIKGLGAASVMRSLIGLPPLPKKPEPEQRWRRSHQWEP